MLPAPSADLDVRLQRVEAPAADSDEDPLQDPFASLPPPRLQRGRLGWLSRGALLAFSGLAATAAVVGLHGGRPRPSDARAAAAESKIETPAGPAACLCLFDVDRTLTGKQKTSQQCPGNVVKQGVYDTAFGGGILTLSALGQGVKQTFCGGCHRGIVSAGTAGGPKEKAVLAQQLAESPNEPAVWSGPYDVRSQYVVGCPNPKKAMCAKGIVKWLGETKDVWIAPEEVYFFDDLTGNTASFAAEGFNARQVSCQSREGAIGKCGAQPWEVVKAKGIKNC